MLRLLENYNRESTIDKLRNLFIRRIYSCNTPNVVELHGLPLDIAEALDRKLSLAPPASPDSKKNWAVKKLIFELKQSGKLTKLIRRKLLCLKTGKKAKKWRAKLSRP